MENKLIDVLNEEQYRRLKEVAWDFMNYDASIVWKYLWTMTYNPKYALQRNGLLDKVYLIHYKEVRDYILKESEKESEVIYIKVTDDNRELYEGLEEDIFAFHRIVSVVGNALINNSWKQLERISFLFNSSEEKNKYGALRSLHLFREESSFFVKYLECITTYFNKEVEAIRKHYTDCSFSFGQNPETVKDSENSEDTSSFEVNNDDESEQSKKGIFSLLSKIAKNREKLLSVLEASKNFDEEVEGKCKLQDNFILQAEVFPKMVQLVTLWDEIKKYGFSDKDLIFNISEELKEAGKNIKDINDLKSYGISLNWVMKNYRFVSLILTKKIFNWVR